jgi:hypothetical protein
MVLHAYNSRTWEAEVGELQVWGQPRHSAFQASVDCIARPCLKAKKNQQPIRKQAKEMSTEKEVKNNS